MATAYQLHRKFPDHSILVIEKENLLAEHQTGRNSGVLHSGIYYKPGSLKAKNCRLGKLAMERFCSEYGINYELCGKVIVATSREETTRLQTIFERGQANGVNCQLISKERLKEIEPHAAGVGAIYVPECGIVNYRQVCEKLGSLLCENSNHQILTGEKVLQIEQGKTDLIVQSTNQEIHCKILNQLLGLTFRPYDKDEWAKPNSENHSFQGRVLFFIKACRKVLQSFNLSCT